MEKDLKDWLKTHIELCEELQNLKSEKKVLQMVLNKVEELAINYTRCSTQLKAIEKLKDLAYEVCPLHRTDDLDEIIERL